METNFDVIFIGAGPGGYTGAIRASQLGLKTAIIEKYKTLGGTCLNVGCIPSKALLDSSEHFSMVKHEFADHGVKVNKVELDLPTMLGRKDKVVKDLTAGIDFLMKKHKIERFLGTGKITSANTVEVKNAEGKIDVLTSKNIILSTGSKPIELPFMKFDGKNIISSTQALALEKVPEHLVVVGGGVIGLELGSVWMRLGAKVTVIEFSDHIAGASDGQMCKELLKVMKKQGMEFQLQAKVTGAKVVGSKITVMFEDIASGGTKEIVCDKVLVAVGRKPYSEGLGLEELGIEKDARGYVVINDHFQTSKFPNVYAVGDLVRGPMLAHKAEEEGVAVAEVIAGQAGHVNYLTVPNVIYTWPELASVGYTEEQLKSQGVDYNVGSFPFKANGRARTMNSTDGLVKILADKTTDKVLGVHILGPRASDIISEAVIAMEFSASSEDMARSFHAHPTLPEAIREAALAVHKMQRQS